VVALKLTPIFTTNFTPNSNPLDPVNWTTTVGLLPCKAIGGNCEAITVGSPTSSSNFTGAVTPANCYAQATLGRWNAGSGAIIALGLRTLDDNNYFEIILIDNQNANHTASLGVDSDANGIDTEYFINSAISQPKVGDVLFLAIVNNLVYAAYNDTFIVNGLPSTNLPATGYPSVFFELQSSNLVTDCAFSSFTTGAASSDVSRYYVPIIQQGLSAGTICNVNIPYDVQQEFSTDPFRYWYSWDNANWREASPVPPVPKLILTPIFTENFIPDANPLNPANWTVFVSQLQALSGQCRAVDFSEDIEICKAVLPVDQYVSGTLGSFNAGVSWEIDLILRFTSSSTAYYLSILNGPPPLLTIYGASPTVPNPLFQTSNVTYTTGDVFTIAVIGTTLYLFQNGRFLGAVVDTAFATGTSGLEFIATVNPATDTGLSLFVCGSATLG
jgi:hypothetical protein